MLGRGEPPRPDPEKTNAPCAGTGRRQAPQGMRRPARPRPPARAARSCGAFVHPSRDADLRSLVELTTSLRQVRWAPSGGRNPADTMVWRGAPDTAAPPILDL